MASTVLAFVVTTATGAIETGAGPETDMLRGLHRPSAGGTEAARATRVTGAARATPVKGAAMVPATGLARAVRGRMTRLLATASGARHWATVGEGPPTRLVLIPTHPRSTLTSRCVRLKSPSKMFPSRMPTKKPSVSPSSRRGRRRRRARPRSKRRKTRAT